MSFIGDCLNPTITTHPPTPSFVLLTFLVSSGVCLCVFYLYLEFVFYKFREWYNKSQLRAKWKRSYFRSLLPHLITGQTVLTKENATEEQLELMRKTEEEWIQKKYN